MEHPLHDLTDLPRVGPVVLRMQPPVLAVLAVAVMLGRLYFSQRFPAGKRGPLHRGGHESPREPAQLARIREGHRPDESQRDARDLPAKVQLWDWRIPCGLEKFSLSETQFVVDLEVVEQGTGGWVDPRFRTNANAGNSGSSGQTWVTRPPNYGFKAVPIDFFLGDPTPTQKKQGHFVEK